jgi:hypothetical protein
VNGVAESSTGIVGRVLVDSVHVRGLKSLVFLLIVDEVAAILAAARRVEEPGDAGVGDPVSLGHGFQS